MICKFSKFVNFFQIENPERLPAITASLFQSPGGRKFLTFINSFPRFVVLRQLKKSTDRPPILDNVSKSNWPLAKSVLPQLISENNEASQHSFASLVIITSLKFLKYKSPKVSSLFELFSSFKCKNSTKKMMLRIQFKSLVPRGWKSWVEVSKRWGKLMYENFWLLFILLNLIYKKLLLVRPSKLIISPGKFGLIQIFKNLY